MKYLVYIIIACLTIHSSIAQKAPKREMRAVWIATVENIDWPSSQGLSSEAQQKEMISLLDLVQAWHLNTVVFQVRPAADAFYSSQIEPWSQWLTGQQGKAPDPYYDPLEFAISECRKRGLDIHVWLNPYRAIRDTTNFAGAADHITNKHPDWLLTYGSTVYFDPGLPQARDHIARVVSDIVRRYDIDGVHMDDYFYPYRIAGKDFPDDRSFETYHGEFTRAQKDDWRRNNVDLIIRQVRDSIKAIKPWVAFGISPFGVWRNQDKDPGGSATKAGQTCYDDLYSDVLKWQKEGWIDYVVPQLYWQIGMKVADYKVLALWWNNNTFGCPTYIGQAIYRINRRSKTRAWRSSEEIIRQIDLNRSLSNIKGNMMFSAKYLRSNPARLKQKLLRKVFQMQALTPVNPRIASVIPDLPMNPSQSVMKDTIILSWENGINTKNFILYKFRKGKTVDISNPENIYTITQDPFVKISVGSETKPSKYFYMVTSESMTNTESEPVSFPVTDTAKHKK